MAITWKHEKVVVAALMGAVGLLSTAAQAQDSQTQVISRGEVIATTCYTCHGTYGASPSSIPKINDLSTERMISTLQGFRSGQRASTIMSRHVSGYSDEEIVEVATYIGNLQKRGK